jgi:hypothetical protein
MFDRRTRGRKSKTNAATGGDNAGVEGMAVAWKWCENCRVVHSSQLAMLLLLETSHNQWENHSNHHHKHTKHDRKALTHIYEILKRHQHTPSPCLLRQLQTATPLPCQHKHPTNDFRRRWRHAAAYDARTGVRCSCIIINISSSNNVIITSSTCCCS